MNKLMDNAYTHIFIFVLVILAGVIVLLVHMYWIFKPEQWKYREIEMKEKNLLIYILMFSLNVVFSILNPAIAIINYLQIRKVNRKMKAYKKYK